MSEQWAENYAEALVGINDEQRACLAAALMNRTDLDEDAIEAFWERIDDELCHRMTLAVFRRCGYKVPDHI